MSVWAVSSREIVILENIRPVRLLDLPADFGVEINAKSTPIFKLRGKLKIVIKSCLYTVTLNPILRKIPDVYSLIYNISGVDFTLRKPRIMLIV